MHPACLVLQTNDGVFSVQLLSRDSLVTYGTSTVVYSGVMLYPSVSPGRSMEL